MMTEAFTFSIEGLGHYFKEILGTPATKKENILNILDKHRLGKQEVVFIGDSINDYTGAQEAGIDFIGRVAGDGPDPFEGLDRLGTISDLTQLAQLIRDRELIGL